MKWDNPPIIKIYEALGSIGDGRLEIDNNNGKLYSSSKNKYYDIKWDPKNNEIMCNDNASYYVGYLGYPAISFLMAKGVVQYNPKWAEALKDIMWKDINQKFKNDFAKTKDYADRVIKDRGFNLDEFTKDVDDIYRQILDLGLGHFGPKIKPPQGY